MSLYWGPGPSSATRQARGPSAAARQARGPSAAARQARGPSAVNCHVCEMSCL